MTSIDIRTQAGSPAMSGARLCASLGLFMLCNFAAAAVIPLLAVVAG